MQRPARPTFNHPVPLDQINDDNVGAIANDLYYHQARQIIEAFQWMIDNDHWSDDDLDYHTSMRDIHNTLQHIAYEGSADDLIYFLTSTDDLPRDPWNVPLSHHADYCPELASYIKD